VEELVSAYQGRQWRVKAATDMNDLASHPCAILTDGAYAVFVKLSEAANGLEQFELELAGLQLLSARSGVPTPTQIGNIVVEGGTLMVLEAVQAVERGPRQWRQIGQALARIHQTKGDRYGLEMQGYFGPFYQDNRPLLDWPTFYAERRLWPRLIGAIDAGQMPTSTIRQMERLILRLPELCGPAIVPSLLHGDSQQNNFISTALGAMVIDPATYYGHPEIDLAYIDVFQPVPDDVFAGYQEELPIDPGFAERRELWRIYAYLAIVTVDGPAYLGKLTEAIQRYV
ncbi:MAG: fructosamine kinase family protein, partial [Chloroflexi bacterium]|nr:fructosamine kinase family protein [Chloroflexota bacterium]